MRKRLFELIKEARSSLFYKLKVNVRGGSGRSNDPFSSDGVIDKATIQQQLANPKVLFQVRTLSCC